MNIKSNKSLHPIKTAMALLNGDDKWLFDPLHKDHKWHFNNMEYLYQKGVIFKTNDNKYLFIKTDLELYVKHNGLSLKEKFEKDSLRNSVIATTISFLALIVSSIALYLEMRV